MLNTWSRGRRNFSGARWQFRHHSICSEFACIHQRHLVDRPVAGGAADALVHVNAVIEIHEVGQIVDARPLERLAGAEALPHRLQHRRVRPDLRVAVHARLGRRNAGKARVLHRRVAVAAIDAQSRHVVLVAERHRLHAAQRLLRRVGRALHLERRPQQTGDHDHHGDDRSARNCIRTTMEDLGHLRSFPVLQFPANRHSLGQVEHGDRRQTVRG